MSSTFPIQRAILLLALTLLAVLPLRAVDALAEPGPLIGDVKSSDWQPLLAALAGKGAVAAPFTEHRWFPIRKEPVVLEGEMRHAPELGLSLRYLTPEERIMIVDTEGILLRDARGRNRVVKPDSRAPDPAAALLPVLRFDLPALEKNFEWHAARDGETWRFDFVPRDAGLRRSLGSIIVWGEGETVRRLEFRRSAAQRVEIFVGEAQTGVAFSAEEREKFFR